jgi:putative Mg2+ transporter-C (MgtC) family protein
MSLLDFSLRLGVALVLGAAVGLERQWRQRLAGLRTNALVSVGAALFVMVGPMGLTGDPTRVAAQVVSGIGFLAGGVIFREGLSVRGLNTAATIWAVAAVGTLAGFGFFAPALVGAVAIVVVNVILRPVVNAVDHRADGGGEVVKAYEVRAVCREDAEERVRLALIAAANGNRIGLQALYSDDIAGSGRVEIVADVAAAGNIAVRLEKITARLGGESGVSAVSWKRVPLDAAERVLLVESGE